MSGIKDILNFHEDVMSIVAIAILGICGLCEVKAEYNGKQEIAKPVIQIRNVVTGPNSYILRWDVTNIPSNATHVIYNVWRCKYTDEKKITDYEFCGEVTDETSLDVSGWYLDRNTYWKVSVGKVVF